MADRDGSIAWRSQYVDDAVGNEIKKIIYDGEGNVGVYYEYAYDKYGNRISDQRNFMWQWRQCKLVQGVRL